MGQWAVQLYIGYCREGINRELGHVDFRAFFYFWGMNVRTKFNFLKTVVGPEKSRFLSYIFRTYANVGM